MATFNFTSAVYPTDTTFIFDFWTCVSDGTGNFCRHLVDNKPETSSSSMDEFVDNLDEIQLPDLTLEIEKLSLFNTTPIRAQQGFSRSNSI